MKQKKLYGLTLKVQAMEIVHSNYSTFALSWRYKTVHNFWQEAAIVMGLAPLYSERGSGKEYRFSCAADTGNLPNQAALYINYRDSGHSTSSQGVDCARNFAGKTS